MVQRGSLSRKITDVLATSVIDRGEEEFFGVESFP